jgi:hypothetical protein
VSHSPEEIRALCLRARELSVRLATETEALTSSLGDAEELFFERLGPDATGRTGLSNKNGYVEHLVFREGYLWVEHGRLGKPLERTPIRQASRDRRVLAAHHLKDLWVACGGVVPV